MELGLMLFERRIFFEEHVAELNLFRLRASRKSKASSKTLSAGQIAAIGRLADEVKYVTGKPHYEEIADLAEVILKVEVSPEQVRDTQRAPVPHWQWVVRRLPKEMHKLPKAVRSRPK